MFAQATSSSMPIVPMSTQSTSSRSPTMSSFSHRRFGPSCMLSTACLVSPGTIGKLSMRIGIIRATSAEAWSSVTPSLSRATPRPPMEGTNARARFGWAGVAISACC